MIRNENKPACANCGSTSRVPIVEGDPIGWLGDLVLLGEIDVCGSFEISDGSPIWACSVCGERVMDDKCVYDSSNRQLVEEYERAIDIALSSKRDLTEEQRAILNGKRLLVGVASSYLRDSTESVELRSLKEGFEILRIRQGVSNVVHNSLFTKSRLEQMAAFAKSWTHLVVAVPLDGACVEALLAVEADGSIKILRRS